MPPISLLAKSNGVHCDGKGIFAVQSGTSTPIDQKPVDDNDDSCLAASAASSRKRGIVSLRRQLSLMA